MFTSMNSETDRCGPWPQARAAAIPALRDYNGTYSSQRQELVESFEGYNVLQQWFVGQHSRPVYRAWLVMALLSGVEVPPDVDPNSL